MPDTLSARRWDEEYRRGRYAADLPLPFVDTILDVVSRHRLAGDAVGLYVGCGNGRNYVPLVDAGLNLYGLDVSPEALRQLAARRPELSGRLIQGGFQDFQPPAAPAYLIAIQVFQHGGRADAAAYFDRVGALLPAGGPGGRCCGGAHAREIRRAVRHPGRASRHTDGVLT